MLAVVCWRSGANGSRPVRDGLLGLPVWRLEVDQRSRLARHRLARGLRRLSDKGVRRVLLPEDFPYRPQMEKAGLAPVGAEGLYGVLAGPLTLAALSDRGEAPHRAAVTLCGSRADEDLVRAACVLCPRVKRLTLCVERGGQGLAARLYREYGAAVELGVVGQGLQVCFDEAHDGTALDVHRPRLLMPELVLSVSGLELPPDWEADCVLAALWQGGRLDPGRIELRRRSE